MTSPPPPHNEVDRALHGSLIGHHGRALQGNLADVHTQLRDTVTAAVTELILAVPGRNEAGGTELDRLMRAAELVRSAIVLGRLAQPKAAQPTPRR